MKYSEFTKSIIVNTLLTIAFMLNTQTNIIAEGHYVWGKDIYPNLCDGDITVSNKVRKVIYNTDLASNLKAKTIKGKTSNKIHFGGDIIKNTKWDADTISVTSAIKIHDDVILEISPGTVIEFQGNYTIYVEGTISAIGNTKDSIKFCGKNANTTWAGIKFINDWSGANGAMDNNDSTKFENCIFTGVRNFNKIGGALYMRSYSKVLIKGCRITNNVSGYGAITCRFNANPLIDGNYIGYNQANQYGGGIWCDDSSPTIINNKIIKNGHVDIPQLGGGIALENSNAYIANNIIAYNIAHSTGGGISCYYSSNPKIINNTICYNSAKDKYNSWWPGYGSGIACDENSKPEIINTILWGNTNRDGNEQLYLSSSNGFPLLQNCVIQGGLDSILGLDFANLIELKKVSKNNLKQAPDFTNGQLLDFSLKAHSPCIDQGTADTSGLNLPTLDYLNNPRIANKAIDIGAIEYQGIQANKQPVIERHDAVSGLMNASIQMNVIFNDLDIDDTHTIDIVSDNSNLQIQSISGHTSLSTYYIVPAANWIGTANITVTVTDNSGESNATDSYVYPLTIMETACGDILGNTVWDNDTVKVTCDIAVKENATLSIKPGTVIQFQDYCKFDVFGKLIAKGKINDTIQFTVKDTTNFSQYHRHTGWHGIRFYNNIKDTSIVQYARFEYGKAIDEENNQADNKNGGAIFISDYSSVNISNCRFYRNYAAQDGSAIFSRNSSPVIINCIFNQNHGRTSTIVADRKAKIINNLISYNSSSEGYGVICSDSTQIVGNRILNNKSGGIKCFGSPAILNTIICNNSSVGLSFYDCHTKSISNIIVYNNGSYQGGSALSMWTSYIDVYNSIIKGYVDNGWGYPIFYNCLLDVTGDFSKGKNDADCIYAQPGFVAPSEGMGVEFDALGADWSLLPTSYGINTGLEAGIKDFDKDIAGNPRVYGDYIDIGPYEHQANPQNRQPLIEGIDDKEIVNFSSMELAVHYWDPDKADNHSITITSSSPHVEIEDLSGDTIGSTFNVVSIDDWEGTAQITLQVNDNSGSENSIASETVNITVSNNICGRISNNSIWKGDIVKILCPITIDDEACLKIMPGTHIEFSNDAYIEVIGTLLAEGTKSDSIVFSAINNEAGWKGINFKNGFYAYGHPAGIMNDNDTSRFTYCKFEYCNTRVFFINEYDKLVISNSRFANNQGQCIQTYEASPMIKNNVFEYNTCSNYESGTIWCERYSNPIIIGNTIRNNTGILGGGINCDYYSNPLIANNLIYKNNATSGGGIYCTQSSPKIINNTIVNNKATNGAGIYCRYSSPYLYNSILWGNEATNDTYQVYNHRDARNISNCMIPDNGLHLTDDYYKTGLIISAPPNFINEAEGDYNLAANSVCINTGSNEYVEMNSISLDILGNNRINDNMVDMGAVEFQGEPEEMAPVYLDLSNNYVNENRPIRTMVGILTTLDPNYSDIHSYSFTNGDGTNDEGNYGFEIVGDTLFTKQEFDYESKASYPVLITSTDNTGKSITESFIVLIRDISEPPVLLNPIPDVTSNAGEEFYFQIPDSTFCQDDKSYYRYTAKLIESNSLPSWINFDQYSGVFVSSNPVVGTYNVEVIISDWHYTSVPDTFKITIINSVVSINESSDSKPISIYPNPSSNYFNVINIPNEVTKYQITDIYGSVILVQKSLNKNGVLQIDLSQYPDGLYLLRLIGNSVDETYKLIKR